MSFRVLVVPEDPTLNGYILKPLCEHILDTAGKPRASITILADPKVSGYADAKAKLLSEIPERWGHMDLILFICDADGKDRSAEFSELERKLLERRHSMQLICCAAVQELEAWLLAGHVEKLRINGWNWSSVRAEVSVKETYFHSFLEEYGDPAVPGGGRRRLMDEALANYAGMKQRCPEILELEDRVREHIATLE